MKKKEDITSKISERVELYTGRQFLQPVIILGTIMIAGLWAIVILFPRYFSAFFGLIGNSDAATKIAFLAVFFVGFIYVRSILGLFINQSPVEGVSEGVMSDYAAKSASERKWITWIAAAAISVTHTIFLFIHGI